MVLGVNAASAAAGRVAGDDEPLVADYLEFLAGRARPNSVLAAGYDLRVFFAVAEDVNIFGSVVDFVC